MARIVELGRGCKTRHCLSKEEMIRLTQHYLFIFPKVIRISQELDRLFKSFKKV
ncbi:aspartyl-phosphate phosphatase Spo0E family protein [Bacillus paramobilis]|uniref:aspartyl-phosphate phosphatase Spo0E family protein n=1 Tax=Bacillus paramobilis TaxID=2817477 RepID=UPI003D24150E